MGSSNILLCVDLVLDIHGTCKDYFDRRAGVHWSFSNGIWNIGIETTKVASTWPLYPFNVNYGFSSVVTILLKMAAAVLLLLGVCPM